MRPEDLRTLLDPLRAVVAARPVVHWQADGLAEKPIAAVEPEKLPEAATVTYPDGLVGIDVAAQLALVQSALAQFTDLQIRTVSGATTSAPLVSLTLGSGTSHDFPVTWQTPPLAPVKGALCQIDASVVAAGRLRAVVLDDSVTDSGCTVRVTVVGAGAVTVGVALPLTVTATGLYLYWPPFQEL